MITITRPPPGPKQRRRDTPILEREEVRYFHDLFEGDRRRYPYFWHRYGHHQEVNYDALITTGQFDEMASKCFWRKGIPNSVFETLPIRPGRWPQR